MYDQNFYEGIACEHATSSWQSSFSFIFNFFMLYYRICRWGEGNSEEFLKWDCGVVMRRGKQGISKTT